MFIPVMENKKARQKFKSQWKCKTPAEVLDTEEV